jgi:hypothetical protein
VVSRFADLAFRMLPEEERDRQTDAGEEDAWTRIGVVPADADGEIGQPVLARQGRGGVGAGDLALEVAELGALGEGRRFEARGVARQVRGDRQRVRRGDRRRERPAEQAVERRAGVGGPVR